MTPESLSVHYDIGDGSLRYWPAAFPPLDARQYAAALRESVAWEQPSIRIFGRRHPIPRLSAWYGDSDADYRYSGLLQQPQPWLPELLEIRALVTALTGCAFNGVLLNRYRNGDDAMGWHSDDEPELGPSAEIAAVSFGGERRFLLRHRHDRGRRFELSPASGSLLLMAAPTQQFWQHTLPRTRQQVGERLSLTFRLVGPRPPCQSES